MIISNKIDKLNTYLLIHHTSDEFFNFINISKLICPICNTSNLIHHGMYSRKFIDNNGDTISINIHRVKCNCCNKTHAIIPWFIIPYCKIPLNVILDIILLLKNNKSYSFIADILSVYELNLSYIYFINKKYLLWELFYSKITSPFSSHNVIDIFNMLNNNLKYYSSSKLNDLDGRNRFMRYFLHIKFSKNIKLSPPT